MLSPLIEWKCMAAFLWIRSLEEISVQHTLIEIFFCMNEHLSRNMLYSEHIESRIWLMHFIFGVWIILFLCLGTFILTFS